MHMHSHSCLLTHLTHTLTSSQDGKSHRIRSKSVAVYQPHRLMASPASFLAAGATGSHAHEGPATHRPGFLMGEGSNSKGNMGETKAPRASH